MKLWVQKARRRILLLDDEGREIFHAAIALGNSPTGAKEKAGDGKTPEGEYYVCLKKMGKYGPSLGVSYPSEADALRAKADAALLLLIRERAQRMERPPWGSPLGGEIYIHGGGAKSDWTAGCIALEDEDAADLFSRVPLGTKILITAF